MPIIKRLISFGKVYTSQILLVLLACLAFLHLKAINRNAVNVPFGDEWEILNSPDFLGRWNLPWIFAQHNEHRMAPTKLQMRLLYEWNHWDITTQIVQNFFIYLAVLLIFVWTLKSLHQKILPLVLLTSTFLLSTRVSENHFWGFQSAFHFVLLFSITTCFLLFREKLEVIRVAGAGLIAVLALYSFSSGAAMVAAISAVFVCYVMYRQFVRGREFKELTLLSIYLAIVGLGLAVFFATSQLRLAGHPPYSFPHQGIFWHYFLHLIANGFGIVGESLIPGVVFLTFSLLPLVLLGIREWQRRSESPVFWLLASLYAMVLAVAFTITMGRAGFGYVQARSSRYVEFTDLLIPLSVCSWFLLVDLRLRWQRVGLATLVLSLFYCYRSSWGFEKTYHHLAEERLSGLECMRNALPLSEGINCPQIYPGDVLNRYHVATDLGISFVSLVTTPEFRDISSELKKRNIQ